MSTNNKRHESIIPTLESTLIILIYYTLTQGDVTFAGRGVYFTNLQGYRGVEGAKTPSLFAPLYDPL